MSVKKPCVFCRQEADLNTWPETQGAFWFDCQTCGSYSLTIAARDYLMTLAIESPALLNVASATYAEPSEKIGAPFWKLRRESVVGMKNPPTPIHDIEDYAEVPIQHSRKPDEILRLLATKLSKKNPFDHAELSLREVRALKIAGWPELATWMLVLANRKYVDEVMVRNWTAVGFDQEDQIGEMPPMRLTPEGWTRVEELFGNVGSTTCFIAMSFTLPERPAVQKAIEGVCRATGWTAKTVDQEEYAGGVMDKILALINQARFVIADYTENKAGVYYEAGYAEGRGLPVISTVHQDDLAKVHFDTRHLNFIVWKTPDELEQRLEDRIGAVINK